ncbi:MAG: hypothetical protein JWM64_698 [Frankiales bacterium]|nr:hypothetical protein [Frankiales bacterium]
MRASRRSVLKAAAVLPVAGAVTAFPGRPARAATGPVAAGGTTLAGVVAKGPALNPQGYVRLVSGPGEPHVVRDDLGVRAQTARAGRRRALLAFAQLTDIHVVDAQSPARVEFLDRYNDGPGSALIFGSAYRPQEQLTPHVAEAMVAAVERVGRGPVLGRPLDFTICTGDNTDNCQRNELRWQIDVLDGARVTPDSGSRDRYEGVADDDPTTYDPHYWHPEGTPQGVLPGTADDQARATYGFPVVKGLLDAGRRPFTATGLSMPWYTAYGNHDGLVQGNFPQSLQLSAVSTGPLKPVGLPAGVSPDDLQRAAADPASLLGKLGSAPVRPVTADPDRRIVSRTESVREHFTTGGRPLGHGYTSQNLASGTAYYVFDPSPLVRGIVLDTVNPNGMSDGSLDAAQFAWLGARLREARDRVVVVFSHHTIATLTNDLVAADDQTPRVLGPAVRDLLLASPNVVLWVNGHTHRNRVTAQKRAGGGGFWEVQTAAHVDWPCQSRLLELVDNRDGTLSVFGTLLDADAPLSYGGDLSSPRALASLARELAANDWQERTADRRGSVEDRNVELLVAAPAFLRSVPTSSAAPAVPAREPSGGGAGLPSTGLPGGLAVAGAVAAGGALALRRRRDAPEG